MSEKLLDNQLPTLEDIKNLSKSELIDKETLIKREQLLRKRLNDMLNNSEIDMYPKFIEDDILVNKMVMSNNIKEFKY